jgi:hypothetical protein
MVDAKLAKDVSDEATREGKTLYAFVNEVLSDILEVSREGGNPREIYSAWKLSKMSREFGNVPLLSKDLFEKLVEQVYALDEKKLNEIFFESGKNFGTFLAMSYPDADQIASLMNRLRSVLPSRLLQMDIVNTELGKECVFKYVSSQSEQLTVCMKEYIVGMFSAFDLELKSCRIAPGVIELRMLSSIKKPIFVM